VVVVTLADLRYRYRQFLIAVVGAGVVMAMALLLSGLANGFTVEANRTINDVGADSWVLTTASGGRIAAVGIFPQSDVAAVASSPGVTRASPLLFLPQQIIRGGNKTQAVNAMGVVAGGLGVPTVTAGHSITGPGQVVVDSTVGTKLGSVVRVGSDKLRVVGIATNHELLGGGAMVYMPLHEAQILTLGGRPFVGAVAITGTPTALPAGLKAYTNAQIVNQTLNSLQQGIKSINNSKFLMWAISAIIISALLYVSALQRVRDFAVLKALGASNLSLLGSLALQAVIVALFAAAFACIAFNFLGGIFSQTVAIPESAFVTLPIVAVVVGLLSSLVALRQATGADPAAAFGG
jgi:putative ABC transport system permease protein